MFVQVIKGKVGDAQLLSAQMDAWRAQIRPQAIGYLGSTTGTTPDGTFIAIGRFESEMAAQANSERPEQSAWWQATAPAFAGDISFTDCPKVDLMFDGGSDLAGFVQIIESRAVDPAAMREAGRTMENELRNMRSDILGGIVGWHGDREFIQIVYFTSEADARKNEAAAQDDPNMGEFMKLIDGPMTFFDLLDPTFD